MSIAVLVALFLTGKKNLELKKKSANEVFSSFTVWIPNILFFIALVFTLFSLLNIPMKRIEIKLDDSLIRARNIPLKGTVSLFANFAEGDSLIKTAEIDAGIVSLLFPASEKARKYEAKIELNNLYNRLSYTNSLSFETDIDTLTIKEVRVGINTKPLSFDIPKHIDTLIFVDQTNLGIDSSYTIACNTSPVVFNLPYGIYEYRLIDKSRTMRYKNTMIVGDAEETESILPPDAVNIKIVLPKGNLEILNSNFLGKLTLSHSTSLCLLDNEVYSYRLHHPWYDDRIGTFKVTDSDNEGNIYFIFNYDDKKSADVLFHTTLPDNNEVPADVFIDNTYYGKSGKVYKIKFGQYNNIEFRFLMYTENTDQSFIYVKKIDTMLIDKEVCNKVYQLHLQKTATI